MSNENTTHTAYLQISSSNSKPKESKEKTALILKILGSSCPFASFYESTKFTKETFRFAELSEKKKDFLVKQNMTLELRNRTFILRYDSNPYPVHIWISEKTIIQIGEISLECWNGLIG